VEHVVFQTECSSPPLAGFHGQESRLAASAAEWGGREHKPLAAGLSSLLCANLHLRHAASAVQGAPAAAAAMERFAPRTASSGWSAEACASASESSSAGDSPWHPEREAPRGPPERARPACPAPMGRLTPRGALPCQSAALAAAHVVQDICCRGVRVGPGGTQAHALAEAPRPPPVWAPTRSGALARARRARGAARPRRQCGATTRAARRRCATRAACGCTAS